MSASNITGGMKKAPKKLHFPCRGRACIAGVEKRGWRGPGGARSIRARVERAPRFVRSASRILTPPRSGVCCYRAQLSNAPISIKKIITISASTYPKFINKTVFLMCVSGVCQVKCVDYNNFTKLFTFWTTCLPLR